MKMRICTKCKEFKECYDSKCICKECHIAFFKNKRKDDKEFDLSKLFWDIEHNQLNERIMDAINKYIQKKRK